MLGESSIGADVRQLVARINEGRFFVACVGQFKRGKSTLLDALVGEPILPTGVVPVTTVPTVLRYGIQRTARVLIDGKWKTIRPEELSQYVSEELNPENKKRVDGVEAFLPSSPAGFRHVLCRYARASDRFSRETQKPRRTSSRRSMLQFLSSAPIRPFPVRSWRSSRRWLSMWTRF